MLDNHARRRTLLLIVALRCKQTGVVGAWMTSAGHALVQHRRAADLMSSAEVSIAWRGSMLDM
jgi:hypothetical protein